MPAVVTDKINDLPKCGGTSISNWINKGEGIIGHPKLEMLNYSNQFTFTIIRNPWDRYFIIFCLKLKKKQIFKVIIIFISFEEFIKNLKIPELWFDEQTNQCEWFRSGIDLIIKYENLHQDFKIIQKLLNNYTPLPHHHKSEHDNYRTYYKF